MNRDSHRSRARARARASALVGVIALVAAPLACKGVLGLDAPELDPCAEAPCADARTDADGASDARALVDAAPDRAAAVGLRCGGGSFGETRCSGGTPLCCQLGDGGAATYVCRANASACEGYAIACASYDDCPGNEVCCHSASQIKCVAQSACANAALVCEPDGGADQCPTGWKCIATFTNGGVGSPYFGCAP